MKIPKLDINGLIADTPIIQGAMSIGVSGPKLAAAVANEGGIGVLAGVNMGYAEPGFIKDTLKANVRSLKYQIKKARQLAPKGILGINLMVAMNHYQQIARAAVEEGIDLIISGAGLPLSLPEYVKGHNTRIAPIVSSAKAAKVILKYWDSHYKRTADMIVVEGTEAGGHLGFSSSVLNDQNRPSVNDIVKEVIEVVKPFREKFNNNMPVIAAGGIFTGRDIVDSLNAGASGVQLATRFVATDECDADVRYKEAYINARENDIVIVNSPVGMPGRVLNNDFVKKVEENGVKIKGCLKCLKGCDSKTAPYCISTALINAVKGNINEGLIFVGSNVYRINKIVPVKELISQLKSEIRIVQ